MKIALGTDHAGYEYKEQIKAMLTGLGHEVLDFGTFSNEKCDYPDFIRPAALAVRDGKADRCIVLGGSGNGEAIAANRVPHVRCALCWNLDTAKLSRMHNDANGLSIGARQVSGALCLEIVRMWLNTDFEGGRHKVRIEKIDEPLP
ncbi:MAG: ribose 5-phosphate isomerase B [Planctomycetes bacterium]|nr:ribose 5-phosphate isomerase B [Planctomycetota bacterium]